MKNEPKISPPRWALRFFRWFCHEDYCEDLEGDLLERFESRVEEKGIGRAKWLFVKDVFQLFRKGLIKPTGGSYRHNNYGMVRSFLKSGWRNFVKYKQYSLINVFGLSIGFAASLLLFLITQYENSYDKFHAGYEDVYRVGNRYPDGNTDDLIVTPQVPLMEEEYADIISSTRFTDGEDILHFGEKYMRSTIHMVDTGFTKVFSFRELKGNVDQALSGAGQVVLTRSLAEKLFGDRESIGEVIQFVNYGFDATVQAVVEDPPSNSSLQFELLLSWHNAPPELAVDKMGNWYNTFMVGYVRLAPGANPVEVEENLLTFVDKHFLEERKSNAIALLPLQEEHNRITKSDKVVNILSIISIGILLISCVNYVNLSVNQLLKRTKEIGVRQVMGSNRFQLVLQFLFEGIFVCGIAMVTGLFTSAYCIPLVNAQFGYNISISMSSAWNGALFTLSVVLIIALFSSLIPALVLSKHKVVTTIKGVVGIKKEGGFFRKGLVVLQFASSFLLVMGTAVIWLQTQHMKNQDTHFDGENVITLSIYEELFKDPELVLKSQPILRDELTKESAILSTSLIQTPPGQYWENYNIFSSEDGNEMQSAQLRQLWIDANYMDLFNIEVVQGRNFSKSVKSDTLSVIINEAAMKVLGWDNIENKKLVAGGGGGKYNVIGVTRDYHYQSLKRAIEPVIHFYYETISSQLAVRLHPDRVQEGIGIVEEKWNELGPYESFDFKFVDEEYNALYKEQERLGNTASIFSGLALLIAILGLFTITTYSIRLREKEIGVRKVLGASMQSIIVMLSKNFALLIAIAFVLILPVGYSLMRSFLDDYHYRIDLSPFIFLLSGLAIFLLAMLLVGVLAGKAAHDNPVNALRDE